MLLFGRGSMVFRDVLWGSRVVLWGLVRVPRCSEEALFGL